jgi:hypothetical protein
VIISKRLRCAGHLVHKTEINAYNNFGGETSWKLFTWEAKTWMEEYKLSGRLGNRM